jgi:hypothetical protein
MTDVRSIPHFSLTAIDGERCDYAALWQRKNLLLVVLPRAASHERDACIVRLQSHMADLTAHDTACVMTTDDVAGVNCPAVVIADRWGEVAFASEPESVPELPDLETIIEWLRHVQGRCPECEGEAR